MVDEELLFHVAMRNMGRPVSVLKEVLKNRVKLRAQLKERGLTPTGLSKGDVAKPAWAREATRRTQEAVRAKRKAERASLSSCIHSRRSGFFSSVSMVTS